MPPGALARWLFSPGAGWVAAEQPACCDHCNLQLCSWLVDPSTGTRIAQQVGGSFDSSTAFELHSVVALQVCGARVEGLVTHPLHKLSNSATLVEHAERCVFMM